MDPSHRNLAVLVIDDNKSRQAQLIGLFKGLGVGSIEVAYTREGAQELLCRSSLTFGLVISVVEMRGIDGLDLIHLIAQSAPGVALLIYSARQGNALEAVLTLANEYGLNPIGVLTQPATIDALDTAIRRIPCVNASVSDGKELPCSAIDVEQAFAANAFEPWFQPKLEIRSGRVIGVEALLRWRLDNGDTRLPREFLRQLEASGFAKDVTLRTLRAAAKCVNLAVGREKDFSVSINVSPNLLSDPGFVSAFQVTTLAGGIRPEQIVVEINEAAIREPSRTLMENLTRMRLRGFGICIDNYLLGHSSLVRLVHGPFSEVKFASEYTSRCYPETRARLLVESTIQLARKLDIHTVASGVETASNMETLLHLGCDAAQGFFIAPAMTAPDFLQWMNSRTRRSLIDEKSFMLTGQFDATIIDRSGPAQP